MVPRIKTRLHKALALAALAVIASGCASQETKKPEQTADHQWREGYERGVYETMQDFKTKMQGRQHFVYDAPITECGVVIPARVVNGALIPRHEECVIVSPGQWVEQDSVAVPTLEER